MDVFCFIVLCKSITKFEYLIYALKIAEEFMFSQACILYVRIKAC